MKRRILLSNLILLAFVFIGLKASSQEIRVNSINHDSVLYTCSGVITDDGGEVGDYGLDNDYWVTVCSERTYPITNPTQRRQISLEFDQFDMGDGIVNIYTGRGITNSIPWIWENETDFTGISLMNRTIISAFEDTTGCFTIRIRTGNTTAPGIKANIDCVQRCQYPEAALDTFFYRIDALGNKYARPVRDGVDTVWNDDETSFYIAKFKSVDFCDGDSIVLVANPLYPDNDTVAGVPTQSFGTSVFMWDFGEGSVDTVYYNNEMGFRWEELGGYNLNLSVLDTNNGGCQSRNMIETRVRIAKNPIKTVAPIPDLCSGEKFKLNVGYGGSNTISIDSINFARGAVERFDSVVFIPDGPNCPPGYYESPVIFDNFPGGALISSMDDIKSICMNAEHTFLGDLGFDIVCPNGSEVVLKFNNRSGGADLGLATSQTLGGDPCDPANNPQGIGWTYCFSNQYLKNPKGVIDGSMPSPVDSTRQEDTSGYFQTPVQTGQSFTGTNGSCSGALCTTVDLTGFQGLIGCPLNGEWKLRVIDNWGIDNGYVFWWDMELGQSSAADWEYQVPLDTVIWTGSFISPLDYATSEIAPPIDSCGLMTYDIKIIDDFGCIWDTITTMDILCSPIVELGPDIALCETKTHILDAGDPMPHGITTYMWEPTGETTQTITALAPENANATITYRVQVTNSNGKSYCYGGDSIDLIVYPAAMASFSFDKFPLEGCEPFTFNLHNSSTNAERYDWVVGQQYSDEENPSFTLNYGSYDLKLKVTSEHGCVDSITQEDLIHVYKSPVADFGWAPHNPSVTDPTVAFINLTSPRDPNNQYHWSIQSYNTHYDLRENVFGHEPSYTWQPLTGETVYGDYHITLDAYSVNLAPSGYTYECHDTISKMITIINDNLIFPTVVTPNGDGINDIFYIKNLVEGQAFPDNELSVYNRMGRRIYFRQDIRNIDDFWDPAKTNTPTGTYFFKFIGRGPVRNVEHNGAVEILK